MSLYGLVESAIRVFFFNGDILNQSILANLVDGWLALTIMLFLEPFLLTKFGTTVGKALFRFRIKSKEGNNLAYKEAFL